MTGRTRLTVVGALAAALAMLALAPIIAEQAWTVPAAFAIALVAGSGLALRQLGVPLPLVVSGQAVVLLLWLGVLVAADVAWFGVVPTLAWAERLFTVAVDGFDSVMQYAAPVPPTPGITLYVVGGAGLVALLVDLFAVGLRRAPLAGVPMAAVYAVSAATAPGGLAWYWFLPPAAAFLAVLVAEGRTRVVRWGRSAGPSATHTGIPETDSLARNGRRVGTVAVAAAVAVPALLPGLTEGILGGGGGGDGGGRTIHTDNPIVELQGSLTLPENVPILRYRTDASRPEYIRRVTLDNFDGEEWRTSPRNVPESQRVDEGLPSPPGLVPADSGRTVEYTIEVGRNYRSKWLPLPYPAQAIDIDGDWRYDQDSLDVVSPERGAGESEYTVGARELDIDATQLIAAGPPPEELDVLLELPESLPPEVIALTEQVTADAPSPFEKAAALQEFFRSAGEFVYDLSTSPGTSSSALVDFLRNRRGYCEQFAASMAVLARAVGIPARVAVGFTPGNRQDDGRWLVGAHDAHAWPELYFHGTGWVRFEPTPATRTGSAPTWTFPPTEGDANVPEGGASSDEGAAPNAPVPGLDDPDLGAGSASSGSGVSTWLAAVLAVAGGLLVLTVPAAMASARRLWRWRRAGGDRVQEAEAAWSDLRDSARDAGLDWDPAATPRRTGATVASRAKLDPDSRDLLTHVVTTTERARYAPSPGDTDGLREDSAMLRRTLLRSGPVIRRAGAVIWPSAARDLMVTAASRVADGLDWADAEGARIRQQLERVVTGRR
ncbi:MAG: transglutaminase domain-containing protein [Jiangellaceae bacterium]|nr:transglutaminase domain-containing protein [Jiangellaceae bacterium]